MTASTDPRRLLADFLREDLALTGTKLGCEHGVCGACTILLDGLAIRSCLVFAVQAHGMEITTVEGLSRHGLVLQEEFNRNHGLQCGYCTPGFLVSATAFLIDEPDPDEDKVRRALAGNICRCTGYDTIVESVLSAAARTRPDLGES